jgi:ATP-dependent DNA ligase
MIYEIFERLLADNGRLAKEAVLRSEVNNEVLKRVFTLALNPYIRFHVRKIPYTFLGHGTITLEQAMDELSKLSGREITGNAAVAFLENLFNELTEDDAKVLQKIVEKDLKCGVSTATVNKIWPKLIPEFEIQLALPYESKKRPARFALEPKIDGMRVFVMNEGSVFSFMTRGGRELETLDHMIPEINRLMNDRTDYFIDTEVIAGTGVEDTTSAVKRKGKAKGNPKLVVFDIGTMEEFHTKKSFKTYDERRAELVELFSKHEAKDLVLNDSIPWDGEDDPEKFITDKFNEWRAQKIEGAIVKDRDSLYEFDRTEAWMKVKPLDHTDVVITGYYPGKKGTRNEHRLGGFTFEIDGVESRVGGGFSDKQRDEFWAIKDEMIGTTIEIEFMEPTAKGATRHCNFIMVRSYKGERT